MTTTICSYLFVTFEGGGNVPPVLGVARRLVERGHSVSVLAEPCLAGAVAGIGARFIPFTRHFTRADRIEDVLGDWKPKSPLSALRCTLSRVVYGPARLVAEETRQAIRAYRPDVVVADFLMPGALVAAEAEGLPRVVLFHTPEHLPGPGKPAAGPGFLPRDDRLGQLRDAIFTRLFYRTIKDFVSVLSDTRQSFGLSPLSNAQEMIDLYHQADLRLIQTSEAFDFPLSPSPVNLRYVGPILDDPDWAGAWKNPWPMSDTRPLVVVSLSSTYQNQRAVLQRIITALGRLDVRGLVTLGPVMAGERFRAPANVLLMDSAPHGRIFPHADAVVTHAGHGTVMRALTHGVPLLCFPMGRDQDDNAARVTARGCGLRMRRSARPAAIVDAIERVLYTPGYRESALRLGRIIAKDAMDERAVSELEMLALQPVSLSA